MQLTREQAFLVTGALLVLAAVAGSFALYWTRALMVPFVLSILVSYLLGPVVDMAQTRLRLPRWAGILFALLVLGLGSVLIFVLLWSSAQGVVDNADRYVARVSEIAAWGVSQFALVPEGWLPDGIDPNNIDAELLVQEGLLQPVLSTLGGSVSNLFSLVAEVVSNTVLITLFAIYQLVGRRPAGEEREGMWGQIDTKIRTYLVTKFVLSATTGFLVWLILAAFGLDLALVFGVLAFLLNFIPSIGSMVATALPLPVALMQFDHFGLVALVIVLPGLVQFGIGNVLEPKIMGDSLDLHPVTVLLTLIFWGLLWGPVGMLLATPITAVLRLVLARFETTRPIGDLLAGTFTGFSYGEDEAVV